MKFSALYEFASGLGGPMIEVDKLIPEICSRHPLIDEVLAYSVDLDETVTLGYMRSDDEREGRYEPPHRVISIRVSNKLSIPWRRVVCCKELMHAFDSDTEQTDTPEKFLLLMDQLETAPLADDESPMLKSEVRTMWMALAVLCPQSLRQPLLASYAAKTKSLYDIALELSLPEEWIKPLMGSYYDRALVDVMK